MRPGDHLQLLHQLDGDRPLCSGFVPEKTGNGTQTLVHERKMEAS